MNAAIRFGLVGVLATGIHALVVIIMVGGSQVRPVWANAAAFALATCVSYSINSAWSFSARFSTTSLTRFIAVAMLGGLLTMAVSEIAYRLGLHYLVGVALVVSAVPPITFVLHKNWTFKVSHA